MATDTPPLRPWRVALASLRAPQWLHFCVLPLAALDASALADEPIAWPRALLGCAIAAGCLAFAYGLNSVAERRSDHSTGKNPLVAAPELAPLAVFCALAAGLLALLLASGLGSWALLACGISLACGGAYSVGVQGKRVPVLGLLLNTGIFTPLTAVLLLPGKVPPSFVHETILFTLLLIQNQLVHELADIDEDREAGAWTTARLLGPRGTLRAALGVGIAIPLASLWLAPSLALALLASVLALAATRIALAAEHDAARARVRHRWLALAGGALSWLAARVV